MSNIKISAQYRIKVDQCVREWQSEHLGSGIHTLPTQRDDLDGILLIDVPEPVLPILTQREIPFEIV